MEDDDADTKKHLGLISAHCLSFFLKTLSIIRTIWPGMPTTECLSFYRDMWEDGKGIINFKIFMRVRKKDLTRQCSPSLSHTLLFLPYDVVCLLFQVAERLQLFSRALDVPPLVYAKVDRQLDSRHRQDINTLIHLHHQVMSTHFDRLKVMLPEPERLSFENRSREVASLLSLSSGDNNNNNIDGFSPFFAYRRLLSEAFKLRILMYELNEDFSGLLTPIRAPSSKLPSLIKTELELSNRILLDGHTDHFLQVYASLSRSMAATKIQKLIRSRLPSFHKQKQHVTFGT